MTVPMDVEFLAEDGSVLLAEDDVVEFGGRRVPRWVVVVACALAAIALVSVVVGRSPPKHAAVAGISNTNPVASGRFHAALRLDGDHPNALDVLLDGSRLYVLQPTRISRIDLPSKHVADSVGLADGTASAVRSSARLLLDASAGRLWVVEPGPRPARLLEFDAATLRPTRDLTVDVAIQDAAVMYGHLYLASSGGLDDLVPGALAPMRLGAVHGSVSAVAADPARRRVLVLDDSSPVAISVMSAGRVTARRIFGKLNQGSIAVVGDDIWVAGSGDYGAVMARLDPGTLAPLQTSPVALEAKALAVSSGARDLWVSASGAGLWCLDARSGTVLVQWPSARAPVTSRTGAAYVVTKGSVVPLALDGCAG